MLTDPYFLAVAIPAVIALGLAKGGFAGVGTIATPLVALVVPPFEAAALLLPILIVQDVISVWVYRGDWSAPNLKAMLPGAALGVGAAWFLAVQVPEAAVRLIVGTIGLSFVLNAWFGPKPEPSLPHAPRGVFWGAVSGFTSAFANAGGPPFQVYMLPQRLPKLTFVGTSMIFFAVVNWMKVVPYLALGNFSGHGMLVSLGLMPLAIAANFLGIWLVRVTPVEVFYRIAYTLVFLLSLALIWQGGSALWFGKAG
ncbi:MULTISPECIES: sulfite exporter TauE/SafE family protein [Rhodomicrobium]|uniref:sulfite exporter TauE/SafE family protein n=1 Tax=Rhodomicrobium TaxID=1068 RepID=UPI000B4B08AE|nr:MULTISPECIES: sulfite exporter TauE/SafE family protein [Rhodomicrobium]